MTTTSVTAASVTRTMPLLGAAHRILRALQARPLPWRAITAAVLADGHPEPTEADSLRGAATVLLALDYVSVKHSVYTLLPAGFVRLAALDEDVKAALQANARRSTQAISTPEPAQADGAPVVHPHAGNVYTAMRGHSRRTWQTAAERQGAAPRPGSQDFLSIPSRYGNVLRYRDGTTAPSTHATLYGGQA